MHTAEKLTNKKPGLHLAFGATRQGPPATEMLRFGARIGSRHETPALSCPSTYSFVSAKSLIYMSQYFAKSPQHASEKIKPVGMKMGGNLFGRIFGLPPCGRRTARHSPRTNCPGLGSGYTCFVTQYALLHDIGRRA